MKTPSSNTDEHNYNGLLLLPKPDTDLIMLISDCLCLIVFNWFLHYVPTSRPSIGGSMGRCLYCHTSLLSACTKGFPWICYVFWKSEKSGCVLLQKFVFILSNNLDFFLSISDRILGRFIKSVYFKKKCLRKSFKSWKKLLVCSL